MKIKIYSGLSVEQFKNKSAYPMEFLGPVKRDDMYKCIKEKVNVVGIIDGEFLQNLAVSPYEIRVALEAGMKVYGASSIGALRAVELEHYGMIGVGRVYEEIKASPSFRDDHLGQIYLNEENLALTYPYVDIEYVLDTLLKEKKLSPLFCRIVKSKGLDIHFSERALSKIKSKIAPRFYDQFKAFEVEINKQERRLKYRDGLALINRVVHDLDRLRHINYTKMT